MTTFTHAGVSTHNGVTKVRFCNDALRVKVLAKNGHKDIDIIELKHAMTKEDAVAFLTSIDFATRDGVTNKTVQAALEAEVEKRSPKAANKEQKPKKEAKKPKKPTLEAIRAKKDEVPAEITTEDQPF